MKLFGSTDILLPKSADMHRWAVIACDQFTSDAAYWQRVRQVAGEEPSTIHMILPEADLGCVDEDVSISADSNLGNKRATLIVTESEISVRIESYGTTVVIR